MYANDLIIGSNAKIDVSGKGGGSGDAYGGSSGGGSINIFYKNTITCENFEKCFLYAGGKEGNGGSGGNGSVSIGQILSGIYRNTYNNY